MSIRIMSLVWDLKSDSHIEKLVLLALADNANDEGHCWPSVPTIARKCDLAIRSVRDHLRDLEGKGWLKTDHRPGHSSNYHLTVPRHAAPDTPAHGAGSPRHAAPPEPSGEPSREPIPPTPLKRGSSSVWELTKILEAKSKLAEDLKNKHSFEAALGVQWDDENVRKSYVDLRGQIKALNLQLSKMA